MMIYLFINDNNDIKIVIDCVFFNDNFYEMIYLNYNNTERGFYETMQTAKTMLCDYIYDFTYDHEAAQA